MFKKLPNEGTISQIQSRQPRWREDTIFVIFKCCAIFYYNNVILKKKNSFR